MKKILFLILTFFILTNFVNAQWPITQNLGSDSTLISVGRNFGGGIKGSLINKSYTDTTAANLSHADFYAGAQIFTTSDTSFWIRNKTATNTYWFKIGGAGGGATGSFWGLTGNYIAVTPANLGIGTNDPFNDLPFKTNNTVRLRLPLNGLERQSGGAWKPMLFDTTNKTWGYGDAGGTNWSLTGNSGTVAGTNFLGTTDSVDFVFKTNNAERIRLLAAGIPSSTSSNDSVLVRKADLSIGVIAKRALVATLQEVFDTESGGSILTKTDTIIYGGGGDGTALRYYWDRGSEGKYQTEYSHSNITYRHSGDYTAGCTSCGLNSIGLTGAIQNAAYPGGVDTSLGGFGWHNGPNDKHFFIADLTNWYAGPGIPANRYVTIEYFGMPFFGAYVNPTNDNPQMLFGRWPSWYQLGDNYQKYGFVNGETAMFVDTVFFKGNVGIGTSTPDSLLQVYLGAHFSRGIKAENLPDFADTTNFKPIVVNTTGTAGTIGTFYKATYWPGGGGTVTGSGTDNYIPRWNGTTALENSVIYDNGTNVGIGTTSPSAKLQVRSAAGADVVGGSIIVDRNDNTNWRGGAMYSYFSSSLGKDLLAFGVAASTTAPNVASQMRMGITEDANMYVFGGARLSSNSTTYAVEQTGAASGTTRLTLENISGANGATFENAGLDLVDFRFKPSSAVTGNVRFEHRGSDILGSGNSTGEFQFISNSARNFISGAGTTSVAAGNFGIGTTSPTTKLHVNGVTTISGTTFSAGDIIVNNTSTIGASIALNATGSGKSYAWISTGSAAGSGANKMALADLTLGSYTFYFDRTDYHTATIRSNSVTGAGTRLIGDAAGGGDWTIFTTANGATAGGGHLGFLNNTAGDYRMFIKSSGEVGIGTTSPSAKLHITSTTEQLRVGYDASNYYSTTVGSTGGVTFNAVGAGSAFTFSDNLDVTGVVSTDGLNADRTITAGGTTGNQTINKMAGTVNFAAAATTLTVTNSLVDANSIIFCVVRTNDATATIKNVVPGSGSFVITLTAAATAETSVGFIVTN